MKYLLSIFFVSLVLVQCTPLYYPNTINTPLLTERGEGTIGGHYGISEFNLQGAYAINDQVGIMLNSNYMQGANNGGAVYFTELGVGTFRKTGNLGVFEFYAGGGVGSEYNRIFIQPSIGLHSDIIDLAFTTRLVSLNSGAIISGNNQKLFAEPAITLKLGGERLKLAGQFGLSIPFESKPSDPVPVLVSIGLEYRIFKQKAQTP